MRRLLGIFFGLALAVLPLQAGEGASLPERYAGVFVGINAAEHAESHSDYQGALDQFKDCYVKLLEIRKSDPDWETALVLHRLEDLRAKILDLQPKADAAAQAKLAPAAGATNAAPVAGAPTNLPAGLPPEVQEFQASLQRPGKEADSPSPAVAAFFAAHPDTVAPVGSEPHQDYPWHPDVRSELVWIGMDGRKSSAWDPNRVRDFNGVDTPDNRNGFAPGGHACGRSPFYVALPFNDLKHPDLAQKWLPRGWARAAKNGAAVSACEGRWVELKNASGNVCYAQWEDAGPKGDDRATYVFGKALPGKDEPGIGLSPAVRDYLGLGEGESQVSWRFVDEAEVRPGAWLKLDEQAVMFTAMHVSSAK